MSAQDWLDKQKRLDAEEDARLAAANARAPGFIEYSKPLPVTVWTSKLIDGAIAYGILYVCLVFVASLSFGKATATLVACASAGVTYLSFIVQIGTAFPPVIQRATVGLSIVLGLLAGLLLLV